MKWRITRKKDKLIAVNGNWRIIINPQDKQSRRILKKMIMVKQ